MSDTPLTDQFAAITRPLGTGYYDAIEFARTVENQLQRAMSLVRLCRGELHEQNAITDKEYADLLQQHELRTVLETHDDLRAENSSLQAQVTAMRSALEMAESWGESGIETMDKETAAEYERIKSGTSSKPILSPWRDISSAPKDGTEILIWREDAGCLLARWIAPCDFLHEREYEHIKDAEEADWFIADFLHGDRLHDEPPTHWMPLPTHPRNRRTDMTPELDPTTVAALQPILDQGNEDMEERDAWRTWAVGLAHAHGVSQSEFNVPDAKGQFGELRERITEKMGLYFNCLTELDDTTSCTSAQYEIIERAIANPKPEKEDGV